MSLGPPIRRDKLTKPELRKIGRRAARLPTSGDPFQHVFLTSLMVLERFCGREWIDRTVFGPKAAFLGEATTDTRTLLSMQKAIELAEMLFSLQHEPWFSPVLKSLIENDAEARFSELEIAALLKSHGVDFRFNVPIKQRRSDFDLVIQRHGVEIATEVKCKIEATNVTKNGIVNKLSKARREQLPPDRPSIIFMKLPETWMPLGGDDKLVTEAVDQFLRGTTRVISVVVLTTHFDHSNQMITNFGVTKERINKRQKFGSNLVPLLLTKPVFYPRWRLSFAAFFGHVPEATQAEIEEMTRLWDGPHDGEDDGQVR